MIDLPCCPKRVSMIKRFLRDETGATVIEYGIILTLISIAVIGGVGAFGNELEGVWVKLGNGLRTHSFN